MNAKFKAYTQERFIQLLKESHSERYTFEKVIYTGAGNKIVVTCKKHGDFETYASAFLNTEEFCGCLRCREEKKQELKEKVINPVELSSDSERRIKRLIAHLHKNNFHRYLYLSPFKASDSDIEVTCPAHGPFTVSLDKHKRGHAPCPVCHKNRRSRGKFYADQDYDDNRHRYSV